MYYRNFHDAQLLEEMVRIREMMRDEKDPVNPEWVLFMLKYGIRAKRHEANALFYPVFKHLKKPSFKQIGELMERDDLWSSPYHKEGFGKDMGKLFAELNPHDGPSEIEVVYGDPRDFLSQSRDSLTEKEIRNLVQASFGFMPCPDWVVFALALAALEETENKKSSFNICLSQETQEQRLDEKSVGMFYKTGQFYQYVRDASAITPWTITNWLFAKSYQN